MDIVRILAEELSIGNGQVEATIKLIDEGNTIPFISRYRKEVTGSLNDEVLRNLDERLKYLRNLSERMEIVISSIEEQGKLTEELREQILSATTLVAVEDLYRPYKQKRRTRATIAREKGLEKFAEDILNETLEKAVIEEAKNYLSDKEGLEVTTPEEAVQGAMDIIAEIISDDANYRTWIRNTTFEK